MKRHKRTQEGVWGCGCGGGSDGDMAGFELLVISSRMGLAVWGGCSLEQELD